MRLVPGDPERLGGYWLAGRLGAGGQGVVYDAYDDRGGRVAIKVLHGGVSERLAKEARATRRVASFCTAKVLEVHLDDERPHIVSEFIEGPNLRQAVESDGAYAGDALRRLAVALATALAAVHEAGVVHRDLKPENVLLGPDGPRVIDFGVARTADASSTGFAGGTPTYMAPEVFTGGQAGPPADVFAWGGVVLYAATGLDPFQAESLGGVMHRVLTVDPDLGDLDRPLRDLVERALAKDPAKRPPATELLLGLLGSAQPEDGASLAAEVRPPRGLAGSRPLGERAEEVYAALTPQQQEAVPGILLRMVDGDSVRRIHDEEADDRTVLARFTEAGLLVRRSLKVRPEDTDAGRLVAVCDDEVAPASAALFHAWPRLRAWVDDERDGLATHARLSTAARRWQHSSRRRADLYHGSALDEALGWAATTRRHLGLNRLEREFLDTSAALGRRRRRRRGYAIALLAALLAISVSASTLAVRQSRDLSTQLAQANARAVAGRAEALRATDPQAAMRLSVAAWKLSPVFEARTALQHSLSQPELGVFTDPDADQSAVYRLGDDGRTLIKMAGARLRTFDLGTGEVTGDHALPAGEVKAVSDDGALVSVAEAGKVRVVDVASGTRSGRERTAGATALPLAQGRLLAVGDGVRTTRLYGPEGDRPVLELGDPSPVVSRDGRWAATATGKGEVTLWDVAAGEKTATTRVDPPVTEDGGAPPLAFSRDGAKLAVNGAQGLTVVDTASGRDDFLELRGGGGSLNAPVFSLDGRFLAERLEGSLRLWRVADRHIMAEYPARAATEIVFSADGRALRYLTGTGTVVSLDISSVADQAAPDADVSQSSAAVLSPDGRVAAAEVSGATRLVDALGAKPLGRIDAAGGLAFGGGDTLAVAGDPVVIWNVTTGKQVTVIDVGEIPPAVQLSPDGGTLAVMRGSAVDLWNVGEGHKTRTIDGAGDLSMAFSPDGRTLAAGADLVELGGGAVVTDPAGVAKRSPTAVSFSPTAARSPTCWAATTRCCCGTFARARHAARCRCRAARPPCASPRRHAAGRRRRGGQALGGRGLREVGRVPLDAYPADLAFSKDGRRLLAALRGGGVQQSPIDPVLAAEQVCARAGGALDPGQWARLIPETGYRSSC
ncbi:WD40 repeat domain-containing serine/threonine protein kinase [Nonomuraea sp. NBC_01738]|uniref:WD40 repeat domain-containing serine/threonine protein kinase n=1 Tax=Nonomuraea sp. NBC_01738 TaxID=2976003 RepID=UPI002E112853|nr:WD40 repeat domain-containing serine/threonine protein kinase [Nonomuraea sp. NBC_01738]